MKGSKRDGVQVSEVGSHPRLYTVLLPWNTGELSLPESHAGTVRGLGGTRSQKGAYAALILVTDDVPRVPHRSPST